MDEHLVMIKKGENVTIEPYDDGLMIYFPFSDGQVFSISLTKDQVMDLIKALQNWL